MKRLSKSIKTVWGISEIGFSIMSTVETSFFIVFLTDIAQLPLGITAIITGSTAIADAISAIIAGIVIDKVNFKNGKYRPWLLYCPPVVVVFFVLMFTKIGGDALAGILIGIGYVMSHFIWNIAWTANRNIIPNLTDDANERQFLSKRIAMGSSLGKVCTSYMVPALSVALFGVMSGVAAYTVIALICSLCFVICYFIHYGVTKGSEDGLVVSGGKAVTFKDMAKGIASNGYLVAFLLHDAIRLLAYYGIASTAAYYTKVVLEDPTATSWILILFYLGTTVGAQFSNAIAAKIGSKMTNLLGCVGCAVFMVLTYFLPASTVTIGITMFLAQAAFGIAYGLTAGMYAMCGTYSEWKTGENTRGVVMAFCSLAIKLAIAIRGMAIPAVLAAIAYNPNATVWDAGAKSGIKLLFLVLTSAAMIVSLIPLGFFKLDDKKIETMEAEIAARKNA